MKNNKGNSAVLLVLLVLVVLVGVFLYFKNVSSGQKLIPPTIEKTEEQSVVEEKEFEKLEEDSNTPQEINNETLDELDDIVDSIDELDEDLSDLEL